MALGNLQTQVSIGREEWKSQAWKGRQGAEQAPVGIVGLGKTEYRAEPQFNASVPGALFCSHAGLGSEVSAH